MIRILCLNDELGALTLQRILLERAGYEVWTTRSSHEALTMLDEHSFDLMIRDFMRSDMSGFELLKQVRSTDKLQSLPALIITASSREWRAEQLEDIGLNIDRDIDGFLNYTQTLHELLNTVNGILKKHGKLK